jgi:hypothetical protein
MGFNIHILSGRNRSTNLAGHAALAASFNPLESTLARICALVDASDDWPLRPAVGSTSRLEQLICATGWLSRRYERFASEFA